MHNNLLKRGQLQIQETMLVLIVFVVIFMIAFIFYYRFTTESIKNENVKFNDERFSLLTNNLPNMAEFKCTSNKQEEDCLDALKLVAFSQVSSEYKKEFGASKLTVKVIYPETNEEICQKGNIRDCGIFDLYEAGSINADSVKKVSTPISIFYPNDNLYKIGVLEVEWYG
ncbi:MAG TPA: hypothetical protein VJJ23_06725 [Candidatus Nanoarchaeia archaeon]|nr:hypothetical protein [Candidatus Nanoarchaeia archaeon]